MAYPNWFTRPQKDNSVAEVAAKRFAVLTTDIATGEVQASPSSNYSILGRLKAIVTQLASGLQTNGWVWTTAYGIAGVAFTSADQHSAAAAITSAPTSGQKLVIDNVIVAAGATAQVFTFSEETSGTIVGYAACAANGTANFRPEGKFKLATADKKLMILSSAAGNVYATAFYHSET